MKDLAIFVSQVFSLVEFPGGLHELHEVIIVVDGGADGRVVLEPFLLGDLTIVVSVSEVLKELKEDLVLGHLAGLHLGVELGVVDSAQVSGGDATVSVLVELEIGGEGDVLSPLVEGSLLVEECLVSVSLEWAWFSPAQRI